MKLNHHTQWTTAYIPSYKHVSSKCTYLPTYLAIFSNGSSYEIPSTVHWELSHSLTDCVLLWSNLALSRMASQFCLTTRSAVGQGLSLKNCSTSWAFSSVTNPAVATWGGGGAIYFHRKHPYRPCTLTCYTQLNLNKSECIGKHRSYEPVTKWMGKLH